MDVSLDAVDVQQEKTVRKRYNWGKVRDAARGRWREILSRVGGLSDDQLDPRKHQPCPRCGGKDRFFAFPDVDETGGVMCRHCHASDNRGGISTLCWLHGWELPEAFQRVAEHLGVEPEERSKSKAVDLTAAESAALAGMMQEKCIPITGLNRFGFRAVRRGSDPAYRIDVYDGDGKKCGYFDLIPGHKGLLKKDAPAGVFLLGGRKPRPGQRVLIVEGVKDAALLAAMLFEMGDYQTHVIGLPSCKMYPRFAKLLAGCDVIIVADLDKPGQDGARTTALRLFGIARSIKIVRLPGEIKETNGEDVRDVYRRTGTYDEILKAIREAEEYVPTADELAENEHERLREVPDDDSRDDGDDDTSDDRPEIELGHNELDVARAVLPILGAYASGPDDDASLRVFQSAGRLVHIATDTDGSCRVRPLPEALVRERLTAAIQFYVVKTNAEGEQERVRQRPPKWIVDAIAQRGEYPAAIWPLAGVRTAPTLRSDGSIVQADGYDDASGLYLRLRGEWPIVPDSPSRDDAVRAAGELVEVVRDFPFLDYSHRSGWVALVLTLLGRTAIAGPCPLFLVDANTRGAGKSRTLDAAGIIAMGRTMTRTSWTPDDAELGKIITSVALERRQYTLFDNIVATFGSGTLDAALTSMVWSGRILGRSEMTGELPLSTVWVATGNNVILAADTARRTQLIRLESPEENPEEKKNFTHPEFEPWVASERCRLVVAGLTILRGYIAAGMPDMGITPWGSYEQWSKLIRGAMVWAGLPDPAATREVTRQADNSAAILRQLLTGLADVGEITGNALARLLAHPLGPDDTDPYPALRSAIGELCGDKITAQRIGTNLRGFVGRVCAGMRLTRTLNRQGSAVWRAETVRTAGDAGLAGDVSSPSIPRVENQNESEEDVNTSIFPNWEGLELSPASPASPAPPAVECNHLDPSAWLMDASGRASCPGCGKFMGMVRT